MKVFLDDFRDPRDCLYYMRNLIYTEDWIIVRNYKQFVDYITQNTGQITHISFDHDLEPEHNCGEHHNDTGYHAALFLKEVYKNSTLPTILVHSQNPDGVIAIKEVFGI